MRQATEEETMQWLRRFGWLRPDADGVERMHTTRPPLTEEQEKQKREEAARIDGKDGEG